MATPNISGAISIVYNNNGYRSIKATDSNALTSAATTVGVWFNVWMNVEFYTNCDGSAGYSAQTACDPGGLPQGSNFLSLPYSQAICGLHTYVSLSTTQNPTSTTVQEVGPNPLGNNYWNTGNYSNSSSDVLGCVSDGLATLIGMGYGCSGGQPTGGGSIYWRFQ